MASEMSGVASEDKIILNAYGDEASCFSVLRLGQEALLETILLHAVKSPHLKYKVTS